jgi:hypothetical protein
MDLVSGEFGVTGTSIWSAYQASKLNAGHQALIREFARCADTLDRLDDLAKGRRDAWVVLAFDDMGEIHLSIDKILDQQIKTQGMLKQLHAEVRQAGLKADTGKVEGKDERPKDMLAELRKRKSDREHQSG